MKRLIAVALVAALLCAPAHAGLKAVASSGGGGGSPAFSAITSGTNTTATMTIGTGASLGASGSGTITATAVPVGGISGLGTGVGAALAINVGSSGAPVVQNGALGTPSSGNVTSTTLVTFTSGTSRTLSTNAEIIVCTSTCTITPPGTLIAGQQFCVQNDDNVSTVITLAAVTAIQYEVTARTSYKSANTSLVSSGAVKDQICMVAVSTTKFNVFSSVGTWN